jgi:hypothetical protein
MANVCPAVPVAAVVNVDSMGVNGKQLGLRTGITKRVGVQTLRHSFATHLLEENLDDPDTGLLRF